MKICPIMDHLVKSVLQVGDKDGNKTGWSERKREIEREREIKRERER